MPVSTQSQYTPLTLFREAENPLTPESLRFIALGQVVEKLRGMDQTIVHYDSNVEFAKKAIGLIADLPATPASGELLNAAVGQLTRRLKPEHGAFGLSAEAELVAAETAAAQAIRPEVDADKALKPLMHMLGRVSSTATVMEVSRYADAAELLLVSANRSDQLQMKAAGQAVPLITHPLMDADDRLGRLASVLIRTPDLPPVGRVDLLQAFTDTVKELYEVDPAYAKECLAHQQIRFEDARCPELIADAVLPAKAQMIELERVEQSLPPMNFNNTEMLLTLVPRWGNSSGSKALGPAPGQSA